MRQEDSMRWRSVTISVVWMALALALGMGRAAVADPVYVVDTGPGASTGGSSMTRNQALAGQFTLDAGHEINALEGWMIYPTIIGDLPVFAVLYGDDGGVPDLSNEIYSQLFTVPASGIPFQADWHGVQGLSLSIDGGTYWLAFEVPSDNFGSGAMPPTPAQELDFYAVDSGAGWIANEDSNFGIRVLPEPGGLAMMACGVIALALRAGSRGPRSRVAR